MLHSSVNNLSSFHKSNVHANALAESKDVETAKTELDWQEIQDEALKAIDGLGLDVEICGSWLWIFGADVSHAEKLRTAGFNWSYGKGAWYLNPPSKKSHIHHKLWEIGKIRNRYGSMVVRV
jgi:hypothetical protein